MNNILGKVGKVAAGILIVCLVVVLAPFLLLYGLWRFLYGVWLKVRFHFKWGKKGKNIIFVYSESPNWQEYIEKNIFPKLESNYLQLNWSERSKWKKQKPLEARIFYHWGGDSEFNPMAIVFSKTWKIKTIRFFQAFKDYKHGKDSLLRQREEELLHLAANNTPQPTQK